MNFVLLKLLKNISLPTDVNECNSNNGNCAQVCTNTVGSYSCSCNTGYRLASDSRTCSGKQHIFCFYNYFHVIKFDLDSIFVLLSDINECSANTDNCAQTCTNTIGSYTCGCNSGYRLDSNGRTCTGEIYTSLPWEQYLNFHIMFILQILMSARPTQTTVHRPAPTLQVALPVVAIVATN